MPENDVPGDPVRLVLNEGSKKVLRLDLGGVYVENRRGGRKKFKRPQPGPFVFPKEGYALWPAPNEMT